MGLFCFFLNFFMVRKFIPNFGQLGTEVREFRPCSNAKYKENFNFTIKLRKKVLWYYLSIQERYVLVSSLSIHSTKSFVVK